MPCSRTGAAQIGAGKLASFFKAGDDVPMQVGHNIAEAGQIDFGRAEDLAHCGFNLIHHFHNFVAFGRGKVGHLGNMVIPNNAAECRCAGFVVDGDNAQIGRLQQNSLRCRQCRWGQVMGFSFSV